MSSLKNVHAFINTVMFSAKLHVHEARLEPGTFLPVKYLCVATVMSVKSTPGFSSNETRTTQIQLKLNHLLFSNSLFWLLGDLLSINFNQVVNLQHRKEKG